MDFDNLIDWLHALAHQHASDQIQLDGRECTTENIVLEAIANLEDLRSASEITHNNMASIVCYKRYESYFEDNDTPIQEWDATLLSRREFEQYHPDYKVVLWVQKTL